MRQYPQGEQVGREVGVLNFEPEFEKLFCPVTDKTVFWQAFGTSG